MTSVILGAGIMLFGVLLGFSLGERSKAQTEEVAKWVQSIEEVENK